MLGINRIEKNHSNLKTQNERNNKNYTLYKQVVTLLVHCTSKQNISSFLHKFVSQNEIFLLLWL